jgi:hypothetical protein
MYKVYFENKDSTMGGYEHVSFIKLVWWLILERINPKEDSDIYYIRKIKNKIGIRI